MQESIVFLVRVQCRRKESSRSLSHLLMSFLLSLARSAYLGNATIKITGNTHILKTNKMTLTTSLLSDKLM